MTCRLAAVLPLIAAVAATLAATHAAARPEATADTLRLTGGAQVSWLQPVASVGTSDSAPIVAFNQPASPSNDTTPSFSGTASDTMPVTVSVFAGGTTEGSPVATLKASVAGGSWESAPVAPPLQDGTYAAVASQASADGTGVGVSNTISFTVNTRPPAVTLRTPPSPSSDTLPSFSGTASDTTRITVEVFEGSRPEGPVVAAASAEGTGGEWDSETVTPPLPDGRHTFTAIAIQPSSIKNPAGRSNAVTFVVDTEPPVVTLEPLAAASNETEPRFAGTATETTPVTVTVFAGLLPSGTVVGTATAPGTGGAWITGPVSPALADGTYTAVATQPSGVGNGQGESEPVTFRVDTRAPIVTLNGPLTPSANRAPSFSGSTTDRTQITVEIYPRSAATGPPVASATADADDGEWTSSRAAPALPWGDYVAVAHQPSPLGNPEGVSAPVSFTVAPIAPLAVTEPAGEVTRTSAAIYGSVNPMGASIGTCAFEFGIAASYGLQVECGFVAGLPSFPAAATGPIPVFARIYGLHPGSTYHFRLAAGGEGGSTWGNDRAFATLPPLTFGDSATARGGAVAAIDAAAAAKARVAALSRRFRPRGRAARIAALLRSGGIRVRFTGPVTGTTTVVWKATPPGIPRAAGGVPAPLLIASGRVATRDGRLASMQVRLTRAGVRVLAAVPRLRLVSTCTISSPHAPKLTASSSFELTR